MPDLIVRDPLGEVDCKYFGRYFDPDNRDCKRCIDSYECKDEVEERSERREEGSGSDFESWEDDEELEYEPTHLVPPDEVRLERPKPNVDCDRYGKGYDPDDPDCHGCKYRRSCNLKSKRYQEHLKKLERREYWEKISHERERERKRRERQTPGPKLKRKPGEASLYDPKAFIKRESRRAKEIAWERYCIKKYGHPLPIPRLEQGASPEEVKEYERVAKRVEARKRKKLAKDMKRQAEELEGTFEKLPKWLLTDPVIMKRLRRTKFLEVLSYLRGESVELRRDPRNRLSERMKIGKYLWRGKRGTFECDYILCVPKPKLLARWLGIGERSVQLYLKALVDAGIVIELGKRGPRGKRVFASGFFRPLPVGIAATKREYFLKDTPEWREVLCRLKV